MTPKRPTPTQTTAALSTLRDRYLGAAGKAAAYLQDRIWYIAHDLEEGRVPEVPRPLVRALADLAESLSALAAVDEAVRILKPKEAGR